MTLQCLVKTIMFINFIIAATISKSIFFQEKKPKTNVFVYIIVNYKVANLAENDPTITTVEKAQKRASLLLEVTAVTTANSVVTTFSNGSLFPSLGHQNERASTATGVQMDPVLGKKIYIRDRSRFFDQAGHQTTNTSIRNKHF